MAIEDDVTLRVFLLCFQYVYVFLSEFDSKKEEIHSRSIYPDNSSLLTLVIKLIGVRPFRYCN